MRNNNNDSDATTQPNLKPVLEDRHDTYEATHTGESVERESTKHNADRANSCNSTATDERSQQKSCKSCDKTSIGDQFESGDDYQVVLETESWRTAKNWRSTGTSTDRGKSPISRTSIFFSLNILHVDIFLRVQFFPVALVGSRCSKITVQKPVSDCFSSSLLGARLQLKRRKLLDVGQTM